MVMTCALTAAPTSCRVKASERCLLSAQQVDVYGSIAGQRVRGCKLQRQAGAGRQRGTEAPWSASHSRSDFADKHARQKGSTVCCTAYNSLVKEINACADAELEEPQTDFEDVDNSGLTTDQVEGFLGVLCEDTEIAELELQMGSFELKVRRSLKHGSALGALEPKTATGPVLTAAPAPEPIFPLAPPMQSYQSVDEEDVDEGLVYIGSPKVGLLRRGRYLKGKRVGKGPVVDVGDTVKKGHTLCYVEQLGTFMPVEAPQAGEIAAFLVDEGTL